jgi:arginase
MARESPTREIALVEAPTSAGAYSPGQEDGPRALREAGLAEQLNAQLAGTADPFRWRPDPANPRAANTEAVIERAAQVARLVGAVGPPAFALVLGGDCTVGVGTVAGLAGRHERLGLVYFDRHADLNVPTSTVDGALDWMGVAHMLDVEGAVDGLAGLSARRPMLAADRLSYLGLERQPEPQQAVIDARGIAVVDVETVAEDAQGAARRALAPLAGCDAIAVHFDVDVVDFLDAPLAENTNRGVAPSLEACGAALRELLADPRARALTVTEFNPRHGAEDGSTTQRLAGVLAAALA